MMTLVLEQAWNLALEISPLMVLGLSVAGLLHVLVPEDAVERHLGRAGWRAVLKSTALAIPLPLCSCSVVPVVASLRRKGASTGASVSFLVAAPQIGADSFLLTQGLFGPLFALWRIAAAALTALLAGFMLDGLGKTAAGRVLPTAGARIQWRQAPAAFLRHVMELVGAMSSNLIIGVALAALILSFLPEGQLARWQGESPWVSMFAMLLIGLPMYVCATASTPIAAALVAKGLHPGAALVFLLAGPATNLVTMVMVRGSLGWKALWVYLGSITAVALGAGWLLGETGFAPMLAEQCLHDHGGALWWQVAGSLLLGGLMLRHYWAEARQRWAKPKPVEDSSAELTLTVLGMTCAHCAGRVDQAIRASGLASQIQVDLGRQQVRMVPATGGDMGLDALRREVSRLVVQAGYEVPESSSTGN
jgi:uncharacterized membrane protein YraQ (UPF0718 family)/copper chaperone CopZ